MNELIKLWLRSLYTKELENVEGTVENETLWMNGCLSDERTIHENNIEVLTEYIDVLNEMIEELD